MLTPRQEEILQFLRRYQAQHHCAPTLVEIQQYCQMRARSSVQKQLTALEQAGYIQRIPNATRAIKLLRQPEIDPEYRLPLLGKVAAGKPVELQYADETVCVPADLYKPNRYALIVKGDSMIEAGILDQDVVIIDPVDTVENGALAIVSVNDAGATIKYFYRKGKEIWLKPANKRYKTQVLQAPTQVRVQGVFAGLIRRKIKSSR
jgi:repressor LexA